MILPFSSLPITSAFSDSSLLGFLRLPNQSSVLDALRVKTDALFPLVLVDGLGKRHTVYAKQAVKNELVQTYFDLMPKPSEFLYLWVELDAQQVILRWHFVCLPIEMSVLFPIFLQERQSASLVQLLLLFSRFQCRPLRDFCWALFDDLTLMKAWVSLPASKHHHHSFAGGLLVHSLECAFLAYQNVSIIQDLSLQEQELTVLAALLHDIAKVRTLGAKAHTPTGQLLDHEKLSLLVLAYPLGVLQQQWEYGALTLQYLLSWHQRDGFCRYIGGNIIKLADQLSTSMSIRQMAFEGLPNHYHFAQLKVGKGICFVNRVA